MYWRIVSTMGDTMCEAMNETAEETACEALYESAEERERRM